MIPEVVSGVPPHELYDQLKMSGKNVCIKLKCCLLVHALPQQIFLLYTGTWAAADNQMFHAVHCAGTNSPDPAALQSPGCCSPGVSALL